MAKDGSKLNGEARQLVRRLGVSIMTGLVFGLVMALASNGFVLGVRWLSSVQLGADILRVDIAGMTLSLRPLVGLLLAAVAILD